MQLAELANWLTDAVLGEWFHRRSRSRGICLNLILSLYSIDNSQFDSWPIISSDRRWSRVWIFSFPHFARRSWRQVWGNQPDHILDGISRIQEECLRHSKASELIDHSSRNVDASQMFHYRIMSDSMRNCKGKIHWMVERRRRVCINLRNSNRWSADQADKTAEIVWPIFLENSTDRFVIDLILVMK